MLQVYIDDSGKERQSPSQVLAGYLASAEAWSAFSSDWQSILERNNLKSFHMVEAFRLGPEYHPLGPLRRNQLLSDLLSCIRKHVEHAFVISIDLEAFGHWFARDECAEYRSTRPYFIGFHCTLTAICDYAYRKRFDDDLMIFFEEQGGESASHTLEAVNTLREMPKQYGQDAMKIPTPQFIDGKNSQPLQAADILAWLCRREDANNRKGVRVDSTAEYQWLNAALAMPNTVKMFGENELREMSEHAARLLRFHLHEGT